MNLKKIPNLIHLLQLYCLNFPLIQNLYEEHFKIGFMKFNIHGFLFSTYVFYIEKFMSLAWSPSVNNTF